MNKTPQSHGNNDTRLNRLREARIARRQDRLQTAIKETKHAILTGAAANLPDAELQQAAEQFIRNRRAFGLSPLLIAVIIQLIPILIQWFLSNRDGFLRDIDDLARDVAYNTSDCITTGDFQQRADILSQQMPALGSVVTDPTHGTTTTVDLSRLQKLIAIVAIIKVLKQFIDWWTK
jgi:hypothetical protein